MTLPHASSEPQKSQLSSVSPRSPLTTETEYYRKYQQNLGRIPYEKSSVVALKKRIKAELELSESPFLDKLLNLITEQDKKASQISFLSPNAQYLHQSIDNALTFLQSESFAELIQQAFPKLDQIQIKKMVVLGTLLTKIGYADEDLDPQVPELYRKNRRYTVEILQDHEKEILEILNFPAESEKLYFMQFFEAILRKGKPSISSEEIMSLLEAKRKQLHLVYYFNEEPYQNPLTALFSISSQLNVSEKRLFWWQQTGAFIKFISRIAFDPEIMFLYLKELEMKATLHNAKNVLQKNRPQLKLLTIQKQMDQKLKELIRIDLDTRKKEIVRDLVLEGYSQKNARHIYKTYFEGQSQNIDRESYLWFIASYWTKDITIDPQTNKISLLQKKDIPILGPALSLEHIKSFHYKRIERAVFKLNEIHPSLDLDFQLGHYDSSPELSYLTENCIKTEVHSHLNTSYRFGPYIWRQYILASHKAEDEKRFMDGLIDTEKMLNNVRLDSKLEPVDFNLKYIFQETGRVYETLQHFLLKVDPKTDLNQPDSALLAKLRTFLQTPQINEDISQEDIELIKEYRDLFYLLKTYINRLFTVQEGNLSQMINIMDAQKKIPQTLNENPLAIIKEQVKAAAYQNQEDNNAYFSVRTTNFFPEEVTFYRVLAQIQGYKEWAAEQPEGALIPEFGVIPTIKKYGDHNLTPPERKKRKHEHIKKLLAIYEDMEGFIAENQIIDHEAGYLDISGRNGPKVTAEDVWHFLVGFDAADREEDTPPEIFFDAYQEVHQFNKRMIREGTPQKVIKLTYHVGESFLDVTPESGIRHVLEAVFMDSVTNPKDQEAVLNRGGHLTALGLQFDKMLDMKFSELITERLRQVEYDLAMTQMGIPFVAPQNSLEKLLKEKQKLESRIEKMGGKEAIWNSFLEYKRLHKKESFYEADLLYKKIFYSSPKYTPQMIQDLKTRARFAIDTLIDKQVWIETNPTSNWIVSPHIEVLSEHTLRVFAKHRYGAYFYNGFDPVKNYFWGFPLNKTQSQKIKNYSTTHRKFFTLSLKPLIVVGTDDLSVLNTSTGQEIKRTAEQTRIDLENVFAIIQQSLRAPFRKLEKFKEHVDHNKKFYHQTLKWRINPGYSDLPSSVTPHQIKTEIKDIASFLFELQRGDIYPTDPLQLIVPQEVIDFLNMPSQKKKISKHSREGVAFRNGTLSQLTVKYFIDFFKPYNPTSLFHLPISTLSIHDIDTLFAKARSDNTVSFEIFHPDNQDYFLKPYGSTTDLKASIYPQQNIPAFDAMAFFDLQKLQRDFPLNFFIPFTGINDLLIYLTFHEKENKDLPHFLQKEEVYYLEQIKNNPAKITSLATHWKYIQEVLRSETSNQNYNASKQASLLQERLGKTAYTDTFPASFQKSALFQNILFLDFYLSQFLPRFTTKEALKKDIRQKLQISESHPLPFSEAFFKSDLLIQDNENPKYPHESFFLLSPTNDMTVEKAREELSRFSSHYFSFYNEKIPMIFLTDEYQTPLSLQFETQSDLLPVIRLLSLLLTNTDQEEARSFAKEIYEKMKLYAAEKANIQPLQAA